MALAVLVSKVAAFGFYTGRRAVGPICQEGSDHEQYQQHWQQHPGVVVQFE